MKRYALILAAGKGTRMKTELPKCAFPILKKPMIEYIIENLNQAVVDEIHVIVGHKKEVIMDLLEDKVIYGIQNDLLGTAHAVMQANLLEHKKGTTLIIPGDVPLMEYPLINKIFSAHEEMGNDLTIVSMNMDHPKGYGRIVRDEYNHVIKIVEENDASDFEKQIKEVNSSVYVVDNELLFKYVKRINKNIGKNEFYLTDIVQLMNVSEKVNTFLLRDGTIAMGINDLYQVSIAEKYLRDRINKAHMLSGVSIVNPETVTIGHNVKIDEGVWILPNTTITGNTSIKKNAHIGPNTELHNSIIDEGAVIKHSIISNSKVGKNTTVGPFAHLRDEAVVGDDNRIGNFVEIKKSTTGDNTKASHLAYIGDSSIGSNVNFGCGAVTVNYDGVSKHQTKIGDDVFIGCNVNLIAPINVGDNVFIAAGSTVTEDVPSGALAIARNRQINKEDYAKNLIKAKK